MAPPTQTRATDRLGRPLEDLRISVTDRCNLRCRYCMPREAFGPDHAFLKRSDILSFEEITRVARAVVGLGGRKLRLTGGEPLLRAELPKLIRMLADLADVEVALTTNGVLLEQQAEALAAAGLRRVTVSLDALDDATFKAMADADVPVGRVLEGIEAALRAGLGPVKVNAVVRRSVNDGAVLQLARRFRGTGCTVRFIEFMDVGLTNGWRLDDVVPGSEIVERIHREAPLQVVQPSRSGEVARRYRYTDGSGEIGVITSVTAPFCGSCTRLRLSADGNLFTCLFGVSALDVRALLRGGASDDALATQLHALWERREDRYSDLRSERTRGLPRAEMSYLGG